MMLEIDDRSGAVQPIAEQKPEHVLPDRRPGEDARGRADEFEESVIVFDVEQLLETKATSPALRQVLPPAAAEWPRPARNLLDC